MSEDSPPRTVSVDLEPVGRRAVVEIGTTVLAAAQASGVELVAVCGGLGICGTCRVRLAAGTLSPPTEVELDELDAQEIRAGWRMACQAQALGDVRIDIPAESLTASQRLQIEGQAVDVALDPPVVAVDVQLELPALDDLRADATRLSEAVASAGYPAPRMSLPVLADCSARLRAQNWAARVAVNRRNGSSAQMVAVLPPESRICGLAVDVGTTKLAAYLVNLASGETMARAGAMNPQIAYGEDVVSRITYANSGESARKVLHDRLIEALNQLVDDLCAQAGVTAASIVDAVVVGNTAMHHLFAGLPVRQLGEAPYIAALSEPLDAYAAEVGLRLRAGATLYMPPNIAGYVGADHVAMLLASGLGETRRTVLALDIGTNTEISLAHAGRLWSCSTASGPAFEGAHIHDGMRAVPGAVERVRYFDGAFQVHTIGGAPAVGICGSGILDAVAASLDAGIIDDRGALSKSHPLVSRANGRPACVLVPAEKTGHGRDVIFTRGDVNEIQLAKGAIRAGTDLLLAEAGIPAGAVEEVIVAGAFGTYLDIGSAIRAGMLLGLPRDRFRQVGNAAGRGAQHLLVSRASRDKAAGIAHRDEYIELTAHAAFTDTFVQALSFRA